MSAYYNEIDPYAAQWLRNLIAAGHIAPGDVDERSIVDVQPDDLRSYVQCHFFAGIGGWSYAARLAGWPDDRPLWTGSCPCQPFSVAGKGAGHADSRHLWPEFFRLIRARQPDVVMGEQVAAAVGKSWLDGVSADLEGIGYACGAAVVPACAVDAPHRRDRLWFVADAERRGQPQQSERNGEPHAGKRSAPCGLDAFGPCLREGDVANAKSHDQPIIETVDHARRPMVRAGLRTDGRNSHEYSSERGAAFRSDTTRSSSDVADADKPRLEGWLGGRNRSDQWASRPDGVARGADGKARRVEPGIRLLAHGVPARVGKLRAYGNAIVPQVAAEVIGAYLDLRLTDAVPLPDTGIFG